MQAGWGRPATRAGACCALPVQWFHAPRSTRLRCLQPNGYIFTSLVNACEKGGQWETAVRLFKAMQARGAACKGRLTWVCSNLAAPDKRRVAFLHTAALLHMAKLFFQGPCWLLPCCLCVNRFGGAPML